MWVRNGFIRFESIMFIWLFSLFLLYCKTRGRFCTFCFQYCCLADGRRWVIGLACKILHEQSRGTSLHPTFLAYWNNGKVIFGCCNPCSFVLENTSLFIYFFDWSPSDSCRMYHLLYFNISKLPTQLLEYNELTRFYSYKQYFIILS